MLTEGYIYTFGNIIMVMYSSAKFVRDKITEHAKRELQYQTTTDLFSACLEDNSLVVVYRLHPAKSSPAQDGLTKMGNGH